MSCGSVGADAHHLKLRNSKYEHWLAVAKGVRLSIEWPYVAEKTRKALPYRLPALFDIQNNPGGVVFCTRDFKIAKDPKSFN